MKIFLLWHMILSKSKLSDCQTDCLFCFLFAISVSDAKRLRIARNVPRGRSWQVEKDESARRLSKLGVPNCPSRHA